MSLLLLRYHAYVILRSIDFDKLLLSCLLFEQDLVPVLLNPIEYSTFNLLNFCLRSQ